MALFSKTIRGKKTNPVIVDRPDLKVADHAYRGTVAQQPPEQPRALQTTANPNDLPKFSSSSTNSNASEVRKGIFVQYKGAGAGQ